jgi:hypothetical protein
MPSPEFDPYRLIIARCWQSHPPPPAELLTTVQTLQQAAMLAGLTERDARR